MPRSALLVGINRYPNPAHRLRGCINDIRQVEAVLRTRFGFDAPGVTVLGDSEATTAAIRRGLSELVSGAREGDVLVFHYSGHGSQVPDANGDEETDGLDEVLCPYDFDPADPLTDDDLGRAAARVPRGAHLAVVLDCCHSGTGLRDATGDSRPRRKSLPQTDGKCVGVDAMVRRFGERAAAAGAVLLAGCAASQTSADARIDGVYHGAHTFFLCQALARHGFDASYQSVVKSMKRELREHGFPQVPQLEGTRRVRSSAAFGGPWPAAAAAAAQDGRSAAL